MLRVLAVVWPALSHTARSSSVRNSSRTQRSLRCRQLYPTHAPSPRITRMAGCSAAPPTDTYEECIPAYYIHTEYSHRLCTKQPVSGSGAGMGVVVGGTAKQAAIEVGRSSLSGHWKCSLFVHPVSALAPVQRIRELENGVLAHSFALLHRTAGPSLASMTQALRPGFLRTLSRTNGLRAGPLSYQPVYVATLYMQRQREKSGAHGAHEVGPSYFVSRPGSPQKILYNSVVVAVLTSGTRRARGGDKRPTHHHLTTS